LEKDVERFNAFKKSFNMSHHTLPNSVGSLIDEEVKETHWGQQRMMVAKAMPLMRRMSGDNGLSRSTSGSVI
jgi:hypothetical protein